MMNQENIDIQQRFKEKVDIKYLFMLQVNRCLKFVGTDYFPDNVTALWRMLPTMSYYRIEQRSDEYTEEVEKFKYKRSWGHKIGTKTKPKMQNPEFGIVPIPVRRFEDGSIDWDDPNIVSPKREMQKNTDHDHLFRLVLQEAQDVGILWSEEGGGVVNVPAVVAEYLKTSKKAPRTPHGRQKNE